MRKRSCRAGSIRSRRGAYTLIELLISCAIIAVLLAFLMAALQLVRESAHRVSCQNNLCQLMSSFIMFAHENEEQLPGGYWDLSLQTDPNPQHWDWLRGNAAQWASAPAGGTIFKYLSHNLGVYRCPSLDDNGPSATANIGPGNGSNGRYDYVSMLDFTGARLSNVHPLSQLTYPDGHIAYLATPVIVEGDPALLNGYQLKSWHAGTDSMAHTHRKGAFYASIDTSVQWINEPTGGCWNWSSQSASGKFASLGPFPFYWGQWNNQ